MDRAYEVIIIGGGPAGLTAGLYTVRARLSTLLLEKGVIGGQLANAELVENFPGFPQGVSGFNLGQLMQQQATKYGLESAMAEVKGIELTEKHKVVKTSEGDYSAKVVIIAGGTDPNKLGVPGEEQLLGRGVSYCATCDGAFFKDQVVAVVGGGDSALDEGLFLTRFASKVIVIHRRQQLRASKILQQRAFANPKMEFCWDSLVESIQGNNQVSKLALRNVKTGKKSTLEASGIFIYAGLHPNTDYLKGILPLDATGHIIANERMETEIPGIFAAGDIRHDSTRQAVTAAGDGATAALSAEKFLSQQG